MKRFFGIQTWAQNIYFGGVSIYHVWKPFKLHNYLHSESLQYESCISYLEFWNIPCVIETLLYHYTYLGRKYVIYYTIIYARPSLLHFYFCPWETFNPMHHSRMNIGKCHAEYSVEEQGLKKCSIRLPDCQIYTAVT